jgi:hypothetical protein
VQVKPPDVRALAEALAREEVRYVLVGGMASVFHGGSQVTVDADLAIAFDEENRSRLVRALAPLHPRPMRGAPGWVWDEKAIRAPWTVLLTDAGRVDLLVRLPGVESFDALHKRAVVTAFDGVPLRVADLDDLIEMKRAAGRTKDQPALEELLALRELRGES